MNPSAFPEPHPSAPAAKLQRLAEEQRLLNEISKEIVSQLDPGSVFTRILDGALALTRSQNGVLMLYDAEKDILWMAKERGVAPEKQGQSHTLDQGVVGYVARTKSMCNVDPSQSPWKERYLDYIPDTRSELAVPILAGEKLLGVLNIESAQEHAFDESDERLMLGLSDLAAVALRNAELYEKAEAAAKKAEQEALSFALLYQAGRELSEISEPKQLEQGYQAIVRLAQQQSQSYVVLRSYEEATRELRLQCVSGGCEIDFAPRIGIDEGINGYVTRYRRSCIVNDLYDAALLPPGIERAVVNDPRLRSLVVIPIQFRERFYGTLGLSHEQAGYFRNINIQFYEGLAQQLADAIYRLETVQAWLAAEELSLIGESAMELTHRLGNQLGLIESYVGAVRRRLAAHMVKDDAIEGKLENITTAVRHVLQWSRELKERLSNPHEADTGLPVHIAPATLFSNAWNSCPRPEHIQLRMEIDPRIENIYVFDKIVVRILQELIKNAIEAMENRGVLALRAYNTGNSMALEVEDTGKGIPPEQMEHIFDLFYSTKKSSGYGLWSARRNATRIHGHLRMESPPGHGAIFTLLLPISVS
jgi:signal transduction histidine kinase